MHVCNDLLFRRFGVGDTRDCACCAGRRETAWHVVGACDGPKAAAVRVKWAERMWAEVQKEVMRPKQALDVRVASARGGSLPATLVGRKRRRVVESDSEEEVGREGGEGGGGKRRREGGPERRLGGGGKPGVVT